ncbi:MAG TPA: alpha/beta hydrolase [Candidatus Acidoferrales bacterium]|nr:alpha/beta hydrolase [Candidatus Acidoferrales bacterium]
MRRNPYSLSNLLILAGCLALTAPALRAQSATWQPSPGHTQIPIWPGAAPGPQHIAGAETYDDGTHSKDRIAGKTVASIEKVSRPTLTVYSPQGKNTGAAVVVFPGGGYWILAIDLEGTEVCDWLTAKGITCVLLKYRVPGNNLSPRSGAYPDSPMALQDAQRTMGLVRLHAAEWRIDPHKVGVLGFSAGGHLVAAISTNYARRIYPPVDAADKQSCRPDFAVALYPGHLMEHTTRAFQLNPYVPVTRQTPPTFLVQAEDDPVDPVEESLVYFSALKKAGVPVEMHIYATGGHAFGLRRTNFPITEWPALVEKWLATVGIIPPLG